MTRSHNEFTNTAFNCTLVGRTVTINLEHKILMDGNGAEIARTVSRTDCSDKDSCPIATHYSMSTQYDWSKCVFFKSTAQSQ